MPVVVHGAFMPMLNGVCHKHGIDHRLTKINHLWTNGQIDRMNRIIKVASTKRYHYDSHKQLKKHLYSFINAYNSAKRSKNLKLNHFITSWE